MNPYASPTQGSAAGNAKLIERWSIRTRLKLFFGFAFTSLFLTFGFFHAFFVLCLGDPQPFGTEIAHRYITICIGIGLPIQCLFSAFAFNRSLAWAMGVCNCVVLSVQLFYVYELIKAVAAGP